MAIGFGRWVLGAALALAGFGAAQAAPIAFTSNGTFSSVQNCGGFPGNCNITNGGNRLYMSGTINGSELFANDFTSAPGLTTDQDDLVIGRLTWVNRITLIPDSNFRVTYTLELTFTQPGNDTATQSFALTVAQPILGGDSIGGFVLSGLPTAIALPNVLVDDFKFREIGAGSFEGNTWSVPDPATSVLELTADFTAVPEPASLALLGAGLLGLAAARRRRPQAA